MSTNAWHIGQEVILRHLRSRVADRPAVVTKIGRKYVYVETDRMTYVMHADTGYGKSDYSALTRILTPEMAAEEARRDAATSKIVLATRYPGWMRPLSIEALEAIANILDEGETR